MHEHQENTHICDIYIVNIHKPFPLQLQSIMPTRIYRTPCHVWCQAIYIIINVNTVHGIHVHPVLCLTLFNLNFFDSGITCSKVILPDVWHRWCLLVLYQCLIACDTASADCLELLSPGLHWNRAFPEWIIHGCLYGAQGMGLSKETVRTYLLCGHSNGYFT